MGRTRDLFKKIRDTKGTFHAKMGSIKDRNCMDLRGAEPRKIKSATVSTVCPSICREVNGLDLSFLNVEP